MHTSSSLRSKALAAAIWLALAGLWPACVTPASSAPEDALLIHGGRIYPRIGAAPVDALLVRGGRVLAIGTSESIAAAHDLLYVRRLDLRGAVALPGFQDAHVELEELGAALERVVLDGVRSPTELAPRLRALLDATPAGTWIVAEGLSAALVLDPERPPRELLAALAPDNPLVLRTTDREAAWVNELALDIAGLSGPLEELEPLPGGRVHLDERGRATGLLSGAALGKLLRELPPTAREVRLRQLLAAQEALLSNGICCVHALGLDLAGLGLLAELRDAGRLELRVAAYLDLERVALERLGGQLSGVDDLERRLRLVGGLLRTDGTLATRGAALSRDYEDAAGERGHARHEREHVARTLARLVRLGLQPAVHAAGDRAVQLVLDVCEQLAQEVPWSVNSRPRLEGVELLPRLARTRAARLGVTLCVQPVSDLALRALHQRRVGPARSAALEAWRAQPRPALAFGGGPSTRAISVIEGAVAAAADDPAALLEALRAYTEGAAAAVGDARLRGRLQAGYACDITLLDLDPHRVSPAEFARARVQATLIDGRLVHRAPGVELSATAAPSTPVSQPD